MRAATEVYFEAQDAIGRWLADCCETDKAHSAAVAELYLSWQRWCEDGGEFAVSKRVFGGILDERGFPDEKGTGGQRRRKGLRLTVEEGLADEDYKRRKSRGKNE